MKNYKKIEPATPLKSWTLCHVQSQQLPGNTHHMMWKRESVARGTQIMVKFCLQTLCFVTCPSCCAVPHLSMHLSNNFYNALRGPGIQKYHLHDFQKINPSTCNLWLCMIFHHHDNKNVRYSRPKMVRTLKEGNIFFQNGYPPLLDKAKVVLHCLDP